MRRHLSILALASTAAVFSACATANDGSTLQLQTTANVLPAHDHPRTGTLPSQLLFVPAENGTIDIYPLTNPSTSGPIAQISGLAASQDGMVVDRAGDLFVVNNGSYANYDYVSEYAPPYTGSPTILNTVWQGETFYPIGVAVDSNNTVYVSNCGAYCFETAAIFVYPSGATSPASGNHLGGFR